MFIIAVNKHRLHLPIPSHYDLADGIVCNECILILEWRDVHTLMYCLEASLHKYIWPTSSLHLNYDIHKAYKNMKKQNNNNNTSNE